MVEIKDKDFKIFLSLLGILEDILLEVSEDNNNNIIKRKTARIARGKTKKLIKKYENVNI